MGIAVSFDISVKEGILRKLSVQGHSWFIRIEC